MNGLRDLNKVSFTVSPSLFLLSFFTTLHTGLPQLAHPQGPTLSALAYFKLALRSTLFSKVCVEP